MLLVAVVVGAAIHEHALDMRASDDPLWLSLQASTAKLGTGAAAAAGTVKVEQKAWAASSLPGVCAPRRARRQLSALQPAMALPAVAAATASTCDLTFISEAETDTESLFTKENRQGSHRPGGQGRHPGAQDAVLILPLARSLSRGIAAPSTSRLHTRTHPGRYVGQEDSATLHVMSTSPELPFRS